MQKPEKNKEFSLRDQALVDLGGLTRTVAQHCVHDRFLTNYISTQSMKDASFQNGTNDYLGNVARNVLMIFDAGLRLDAHKMALENGGKRLASRTEGYNELKRHMEQDADLAPDTRAQLLADLAETEAALAKMEIFCVKELTDTRNLVGSKTMEEKPQPATTNTVPARLSNEEAEARWVEKLGLKPGEKPVSMTTITKTQRADGSWSVGG